MSRVDYGFSRDLKRYACGRSAYHILSSNSVPEISYWNSLVTSIVLSIIKYCHINVSKDTDVIDWWKRNESKLPHWSEA